MTSPPSELLYATTHEWVKTEDHCIVRIGITDFAQQQLGDLVFVQLPEIGRKLASGEPCAVVESVKTASDLHSPVNGEIIDVNERVSKEPERVNDDPYGTWLFCIKADDLEGLNNLMSASDYANLIEQ